MYSFTDKETENLLITIRNYHLKNYVDKEVKVIDKNLENKKIRLSNKNLVKMEIKTYE